MTSKKTTSVNNFIYYILAAAGLFILLTSEVQSHNESPGGRMTRLDIRNYQTGIYFMIVENSNRKSIYKTNCKTLNSFTGMA